MQETFDAFVSSLAMIIVTELGDKTFFIAAIMSMKNPKLIVFAGAFLALAVMTVLSTVLGWLAPQLIPQYVTAWISSLLFLYFGYKMLQEAREHHHAGSEDSEEMQEAAAEIQKSSKQREDPESGEMMSAAMMAVLVQAFTLTFLGEWGDRSQIATIALASHKNPFAVCLGAALGHWLCTGLACIGGSYFARSVSMRTVHLLSAAVFILFGVAGIANEVLLGGSKVPVPVAAV